MLIINGVRQVSADDLVFTPAGDIVATDVQAAIEELDDEKMKRITSVDNEIARFESTGGDVQGYSSDAPTISDDGDVTILGWLKANNIEIANDDWLAAANFAGTDYINMFKVNIDDEIETGATLVVGTMEAIEDAGAITGRDMPVSSNAIAGAEMSFTDKVAGANIITIGSEADGAGGTQNPKIVAHCGLNLKEITTPTAKVDYGAIYTKSDNLIYFQDGAGVEHEVSVVGNHYAEMYLNDNSNATVIETADTPIALRQFTAGSLKGWTFNAGSTGGITAYADGTGKVNVSSAAHGLVTGDIITIRGSVNYKGVWQITRINDGSFSIPDTWVADDGPSDWDEGSHLIAGVGAAGEYAMTWDLSASEGGAAGSYVFVQIYTNTTGSLKGIARRKFSNNDQKCASGQALLTIADNDKVYATVQSTGVNDITNQFGGISLRRR